MGHCKLLPGGQLSVSVKWGKPYSGDGTDTFRIAAPGVLHVDTVMSMDDGPVLRYRMVYHIRGHPHTAGEQH